MAEDTYQVSLEIETGKTSDGNDKKPTYKILEVLRFLPAQPEIQDELTLEDGDKPEKQIAKSKERPKGKA